MKLPSDPFMLLSYINTNLRDQYESFEDLCASLDIDAEAVKAKLQDAGFDYDEKEKKFR